MSLKTADDIQALRYGIEALRLLNSRESISSAELVAALGLSRAAAYRVLNTLASLGYISRVPSPPAGRYRLSVRVRSLSNGFGGDRRLVHVARPLMMEFTERHGWPLALTIPAGDRNYARLTTDHAAPRALKRYRAGFYGYLLASASGILTLAHMDEPMRSSVIAELRRKEGLHYELARDQQKLHRILEIVKKRDFAEYVYPGDREQNLAVPLRMDGALVATLVMRFMLVAAGAEGRARRLTQLRDLAAAIERSVAAS